MASWNQGYVTDIPYTFGYYRELSPTLQRFALLAAGFAPPAEGPYLELGSGQGLSACIHAAATDSEIWATDFNPTQTLNALDLLRRSGVQARIFDQSFAELAEREDLPAFSHVAAHGIWTWVSNENRSVIVDLLKRRLQVGGAAYLSYNTLPGWGSAAPLRHLMSLHASVASAPVQATDAKVDAAMTFAKRLVEAGAVYFRTHPEVVQRLKHMEPLDRHYLAHEYFNRDWAPMHFADFANWLAPAKVDFAASVYLLDQVEELNLSAAAQSMLRETHNEVLRETLRDYQVNQFFRRDIFQRGRRRLAPAEQSELLDETRFALQTESAQVPLKMNGPLGEVSMQEELYRPLLEALADEGYRPKRLRELRARLPQMTPPQVLQAVKILVGLGHVHPAQSEEQADAARARSARFNAEVCRRARYSGETLYLASPEIGAGVMVSQIEQLFLQARASGQGKPAECARATWAALEQQGFRLRKAGQPLETPEANLAELERLAAEFSDRRLPILRALAVA